MNFADSGAEDYALAFFDWQLEVSGHPKVFGVRYLALQILDILDVAIPVGLINPYRLVRKLHV